MSLFKAVEAEIWFVEVSLRIEFSVVKNMSYQKINGYTMASELKSPSTRSSFTWGLSYWKGIQVPQRMTCCTTSLSLGRRRNLFPSAGRSIWRCARGFWRWSKPSCHRSILQGRWRRTGRILIRYYTNEWCGKRRECDCWWQQGQRAWKFCQSWMKTSRVLEHKDLQLMMMITSLLPKILQLWMILKFMEGTDPGEVNPQMREGWLVSGMSSLPW